MILDGSLRVDRYSGLCVAGSVWELVGWAFAWPSRAALCFGIEDGLVQARPRCHNVCLSFLFFCRDQ